jgi:FKBP-type peptidyl-prolyl cis-trans isomerase
MKVGGRREIVIPPKYGYGTTAQGPIKKHETLVFVVDLEAVSS